MENFFILSPPSSSSSFITFFRGLGPISLIYLWYDQCCWAKNFERSFFFVLSKKFRDSSLSLIWAHIKFKENSRFHAALTRKNFWFLSNVFNLSFCFMFLSWVTQSCRRVLRFLRFFSVAEATFFSCYPSMGEIHVAAWRDFFLQEQALSLCRWIQELY